MTKAISKSRTRFMIDLEAARTHVRAIAGDANAPVCFRCTPERPDVRKKHDAMPKEQRARVKMTWRNLPLAEATVTLREKNAKGRSVYVIPQVFNGGTKTEHCKAVRVVVLDLDGTPLPPTWEPLPSPHLILETSPGKYQAWWRIEQSQDFDLWKSVMQRLATMYGGDPNVARITQPFRLAGFYHVKRKPFRSRIVELNDAPPTTLFDLDFDLPAASSDDRADNNGEVEAGKVSADELRRSLSHVPVKPFNHNYELWLKFAMAAHHMTGGAGREAFIEWCVQDPDYADAAAEIESAWDCFKDGKAKVVTIGTYNKILKEIGASTEAKPQEDLLVAQDFEDAPPITPECGGEVEIDPAPEEFGEGTRKIEDGRAVAPVRWDVKDLPRILDDTQSALTAREAPLYQVQGRLVHPVQLDKGTETEDLVRRPAGALIVRDVHPLRLREYLIETVLFYSLKRHPKSPNKWIRTACAAPQLLANHLLERPDKWTFRKLNGVVHAPTLRVDGSLLTTPGYDPTSGILYDPNGVEYPAVDDKPTRADALEALDVLKEPFCEFPFVLDDPEDSESGSASLSVLLSAVLTGLTRRTLPSAPVHAITAPEAGTGKTLLNDCVSLIVSGRVPTAMSQGANEEEDEKRYLSALMPGDPVVLIDNVSRPISGDAFCTILTQPTWQSRYLGQSRMITVPTNVLWLITGNNLVFEGDMTTRVVVCTLDAGVEQPERRRFERDLRAWIPEHRPRLVAAGLTILRAFIVAKDRPKTLAGLEPYGRFEGWSNLIRGALVWLGEPDPCGTRRGVAETDPKREAFIELLQAIHERLGDKVFSVKQLAKAAELDFENERLMEAIRGTDRRLEGPGLGRYLQAHKNKIVTGLQLRATYNKSRQAWDYQVTKISR